MAVHKLGERRRNGDSKGVLLSPRLSTKELSAYHISPSKVLRQRLSNFRLLPKTGIYSN